MEARGWDQLDVLLITGDAYIDHPSFGIPLLGRYLERMGYRVGILAQPDWRTPEPFLAMGRPRLYVGISAGAMDSMVSNYTVNRKFRYVDAYSPDGKGGLRPNRAALVYSNRIRETMPPMPVVVSGIDQVCDAGDMFFVSETLRQAEEAADQRRQRERHTQLAAPKLTLDTLFSQMQTTGGEPAAKEIRIILKTDQQGTVDVLKGECEKIKTAEVKTRAGRRVPAIAPAF